MPFTFSHPALILPFSKLNKMHFSMTGLVCGSIVPDFEYFFKMAKEPSQYSHSIGGLFWFDLPLGIVLVILFHKFIKRPLIMHLPSGLYHRFSIYQNQHWTFPSGKQVIIFIYSILLGSSTHLLWDTFTHFIFYFGGYGQLHINLFITTIYFNVYLLFHFINSVAGLSVLFWAIQTMPVYSKLRPSLQKDFYWAGIAILTFLIFIFRIMLSDPLRHKDMVATFFSALLLSLLCVSTYYTLRRFRAY